MGREAYKELVKTTVFSEKIEHIVSINGDIQVAISLIHIKNMDVYIYGMGESVFWFIKVLKNHGIKVNSIIDIDYKKCGIRKDEGIEVITPDMFKKRLKDPEKAFVFIYTLYFQGMLQNDIIQILHSAGVSQFYSISQEERRCLSMDTVTWMDADRNVFYKEHIGKIMELVDILSDVRSIEILNEYLRTYSEGCAWSLPETPDEYKYFYGEYCEGIPEHLYIHKEDEVWINCGAYIGDTIFNYFRCGLDAKKIYAFESDERTFLKLCSNISRLPKKLSAKIVLIKEFIAMDTNWNKYLGDNRITLMNADIEGNELALLEATAERIKNDRPVIAICLYHRKEDIIKVSVKTFAFH